jgi:hypothetical protein
MGTVRYKTSSRSEKSWDGPFYPSTIASRSVSSQGLAKMKRMSGRPKDLLDLEESGIDEEST